ncbi:hypothetical protein, partial [Campylobacter coli]|uniref:hypothetical protein n=1 Tax=Campylobacter coli TaxID=195 RepID=UPI0031FE0339
MITRFIHGVQCLANRGFRKRNNKREVSYSRTKITYAHAWRGFPGGLDDEESACDGADLGSTPESGKLPWRREWLPKPVLLPGESHG